MHASRHVNLRILTSLHFDHSEALQPLLGLLTEIYSCRPSLQDREIHPVTPITEAQTGVVKTTN